MMKRIVISRKVGIRGGKIGGIICSNSITIWWTRCRLSTTAHKVQIEKSSKYKIFCLFYLKRNFHSYLIR